MNLLATPSGRKLIFGVLYFSEGVPIGFLWWTLPTTLRAEGMPVGEITALTSLLVLPWVFKFLWSPLIDVVRTSRWTFRSWIVAAQAGMALTLLPVLVLDLHVNVDFLVPLLFLHACCAATQDAAIDALSINIVPANERGSINGWMQAGMLTGRSLIGGGALVLADVFGGKLMYGILIGIILGSMVLLLAATKEPASGDMPDRRKQWGSFLSALRNVFQLRNTWLGLLFALVGGAAFEAVGAVAGPLLIDQGFSTEEVGWFFALPAVGGMLVGAIVGGYLADRFGRRRIVGMFLILVALMVAAIGTLTKATGSHAEFLLLLSFLYFSIGLYTAASYALFMDLTNPVVGATQFSAYMGATNGCESWATYAVGAAVMGFGYPAALLMMAGISLIGIPVLILMRQPDVKLPVQA